MTERSSITPDAMPSGADFWATPPGELHPPQPLVEAEIKRGFVYDVVAPDPDAEEQ